MVMTFNLLVNVEDVYKESEGYDVTAMKQQTDVVNFFGVGFPLELN